MNKTWLLIGFLVLGGCGSDEPPAGEEPQVRYIVLRDDGISPSDNASHSCLRDTQSGLIWELKTDQEGLHDWRNTYSWFNPTQSHRELDYRGTADAGNDYSFQPDSAWVWSFQHGHDRVDWKKSPKFVRLVRGYAADLPAVKE